MELVKYKGEAEKLKIKLEESNLLLAELEQEKKKWEAELEQLRENNVRLKLQVEKVSTQLARDTASLQEALCKSNSVR